MKNQYPTVVESFKPVDDNVLLSCVPTRKTKIYLLERSWLKHVKLRSSPRVTYPLDGNNRQKPEIMSKSLCLSKTGNLSSSDVQVSILENPRSLSAISKKETKKNLKSTAQNHIEGVASKWQRLNSVNLRIKSIRTPRQGRSTINFFFVSTKNHSLKSTHLLPLAQLKSSLQLAPQNRWTAKHFQDTVLQLMASPLVAVSKSISRK